MSIGEDKVISHLVNLELYGSDNGKIEAFGGNVVRAPSEYITKVLYSFDEFLSQVAPITNGEKASTPLLRELGMKIGFFMLGDMIDSETWKEEVMPYINNNEDWVLAAVSTLNSMGIGKWKIRDFEPNNKLLVNLYDSIEANYYLKHNKLKENQTICSLSTGIITSLMALVYDANISEMSNDDSIDINLYKSCCKSGNSFIGREIGDLENKKRFIEILVERP
jgi:hypothetical protein